MQLDLERFERLVEDGRRALAQARAEEAAGLLREALELWRGPPLADLAFEPFAPAEIARLDEQRLAAVEARVEADLTAGRAAELVPELQRLIGEHPLRERLHGQLMLALYRSGRQADALEAYRPLGALWSSRSESSRRPSCGGCTRRSCARTRRWTSSRRWPSFRAGSKRRRRLR